MLDFNNLNYLAITVAALVSFAIGAVWYTALFGKFWQKEVGLTDEQTKNTNMALTYGGSSLMMLLMAYGLAVLLNSLGIAGYAKLGDGATAGVLIGLLFASTSMAINYLYQLKSVKLFLIDAAYQTLFLVISAIILTVWR